jgi:hypothetical protein
MPESPAAATLTIDDPETLRLLQELAGLTGESPAEALKRSVAERLDRERRKRGAAFPAVTGPRLADPSAPTS